MPFIPPPYGQSVISSLISVDETFSWNVLSLIQISKTFEWDVGKGPLYWFVVESVPATTCPSLTTYVQYDTVMATGVEDLCSRLLALRFNKKVRSVKRWTTPVLECDVQSDIQRGIPHDCNELEEIDFCVPECASFQEDCYKVDNLTWYSEYFRLLTPEVNVGDIIIQGQKIAEIMDYLHFGIGDGQIGGNIGQTLNFDDFFYFPAEETRPVVLPPNATIFTNDEITYVKAHTVSPVNRDLCDWVQLFGSIDNSGYEYYAMDLSCSSNQNCYNACGGYGVTTEVFSIVDAGVDGFQVILKHFV